MKQIMEKRKKMSIIFVFTTFLMMFLCLIGNTWFGNILQETLYKKYYTLYINGEKIGSSLQKEELNQAYKQARVQMNREDDKLKFVDAQISIQSSKALRLKTDSKHTLEKKSLAALETCVDDDMKKAYVINVDGYMLTLESLSEVIYLFNEVKNEYTTDAGFENYVNIDEKYGHTSISLDVAKADLVSYKTPLVASSQNGSGEETVAQENTGDGVKNVQFGEKVEIIPCYVEPQQLENVSDALTKSKTSSDAITVIVDEKKTYQEDYMVETQYQYNSNLYNTEQNIIQQGSNGTKQIVANITYKNGVEINREIESETIIKEAVPQIIEIGTAIPPTYIKPIKGGTFSSGFGFRWGTTHKGVDWACPIGTNVSASCDGKVIQAGWMNGYGYCVTIQHSNGDCTRYGHLSQVLVTAGQKVTQGERIALSGNTGDSTGPHIHFEIIVNGSQVDPITKLS